MPITQGQMIEQMREARELHTSLVQLRETLIAYTQSARERYPDNPDLQEVLRTIQYTIKNFPVPTDRATYVNERYYSRRAKWNIKAQLQQEQKRRQMGIPTKEMTLQTRLVRQQQSEAVGEVLANDPTEHTPQPSLTYRDRPKPSFHRDLKIPDDTNEPSLEFDSATPDDLQNSFAMGMGLGLDTTSQSCEDTSGNPAKERKP